jgi:hypothetical protein
MLWHSSDPARQPTLHRALPADRGRRRAFRAAAGARNQARWLQGWWLWDHKKPSEFSVSVVIHREAPNAPGDFAPT